MSERDFAIGERKFKLNKIDAFKQFHIVRRIGPILGDLIPIANKLSKMSDDQRQENMFEAITPIMIGISKLSDEDSNKVLLGLLASVEMQQGAGNWARVATSDQLMFSDLDLPLMLQIAGRAFQFNLSGFFAVLPQTSHGGA